MAGEVSSINLYSPYQFNSPYASMGVKAPHSGLGGERYQFGGLTASGRIGGGNGTVMAQFKDDMALFAKNTGTGELHAKFGNSVAYGDCKVGNGLDYCP